MEIYLKKNYDLSLKHTFVITNATDDDTLRSIIGSIKNAKGTGKLVSIYIFIYSL